MSRSDTDFSKDDKTIFPQTEVYLRQEFLYKYREFDNKNKNMEWIQRIFTHNELYFPSPQQFNDPFDCRVQASFEASDDDWENYLKDRHPEWDHDKRQMVKVSIVAHEIVNDVQGMIYKIGCSAYQRYGMIYSCGLTILTTTGAFASSFALIRAYIHLEFYCLKWTIRHHIRG